MRTVAIVEGAATALRANAMRSLLTALGLVIGIASVVVMTAFGNGLEGLVLRQIATFDRTLTMILPQAAGASGQIAGSPGYLRDRDLAAVRRSIGGVELVGGLIRRAGRLSAGGRSWTTQLTGADEDAFELLNLRLVSGRLFAPRDHGSAAPVVLVGEAVRRRLFGGRAFEDVGPVRLNGSQVSVVGIVRSTGGGLGVDQDDAVYVPLSTARRRLAAGGVGALPPDAVQSIWITFRSDVAAWNGRRALEALLDRRYGLRGSDLRSYSIVSMREELQKSRKAVAAFGVALAGIASISLLVGGIGIMNMMLVSVTERTGEIGLRMAVGASPGAVTGQFLAESVMLCLVGGTLGVAVGTTVTALLRIRMPEWPIELDVSSMGLAVVVSCVVGVFFGLAPAVRASRLSPVEALKRG